MKNQYVISAVVVKNKRVLTQKIFENGEMSYLLPYVLKKIGESPEAALIRYFEEYFSASIMVREWIGTIEKEKNDTRTVTQAYYCTVDAGKIDNNEEHEWIPYKKISEYKWMSDYSEMFRWSGWRLDSILKYKSLYREKKDDLVKEITDRTKTVRLMDAFEGNGKTHGPYKRLIFKNSYIFFDGNYKIQYRLIIERYPDVNNTEGNITFSDFLHFNILRLSNYDLFIRPREKSFPGEVFVYCEEELKKAIKLKKRILQSKEFYFNKPFRLRAQNSTNIECEQYGSTDDYAFVGVIIDTVEKIMPNKKNLESRKIASSKKEYQVDIIRNQKGKFFKVYKNDDIGYMLPYKVGLTEEDVIKQFKALRYKGYSVSIKHNILKPSAKEIYLK